MTPRQFVDEVIQICDDTFTELDFLTAHLPEPSESLLKQMMKLKSTAAEQLSEYRILFNRFTEDKQQECRKLLDEKLAVIKNSPVWTNMMNVICRFYALRHSSWGELICSFQNLHLFSTEQAYSGDL